MDTKGQNTPAQHQLVQAPSGLWLPRQAQNTSQSNAQPHLVQTSSALPTQATPQKQIPSTIRHSWPEKTLAGKTLWEWMSLLLVPLLVGIGTIAVTWQQTYAQNALSQQQYENAQKIAQQARLNDIQIAQQARFDDIFKEYRNSISTLILDKNLKTSPSGNDVKSIAHSQTLAVLRQVDGDRKGKVIAYLADLGLIQGEHLEAVDGQQREKEPTISLFGADLSFANLVEANLSFANLVEANLEGAHLGLANLRGAHLRDADLVGARLESAYLIGTDLSRTHLGGAYLDEADLTLANLTDADLKEANLEVADLRGANLENTYLRDADLRNAKNTTPSQLSQAISLSNTIMPDGIKHPCRSEELEYCQ
jgi:uncharacterized protein YjbI with pentapeptide repeats